MPNLLDNAIALARSHETPWPRDPDGPPSACGAPWGVHHDDPAPFNRLRGPVHARGPQSGVIWLRGRALAAWGEPERADLTFSVAKTCLALLAGVAQADGLLPDEHEPVVARLPGMGFDSPHNGPITWAMLLEQTSEWEGVCFGVPDTVDRWRQVAQDPRKPAGPKGSARPLQRPGHYWEYNDVRINQLSLALLHLFRRPLPEVFLERILQPLGGGAGMAWKGYDDAWVDLPEVGRVQSVPGGTHWGGGLSISSHDLCRLGQLLLDDGSGVLPPGWVCRMCTPVAVAPFYGRLLWLNGDGQAFPGASREAVFMLGAGGHLVWVDPPREAVVVLRWLDPGWQSPVLQALAAALDAAADTGGTRA